MSRYKVTVVAEVEIEAQNEEQAWSKALCEDNITKILQINDVEHVEKS